MESGLAGRVALVTGGTRGIGLAIAEALVTEGARVAVVSRDRGDLDATVERLGGSGCAHGIEADLTREDEAAAAVRSAADWGGALNVVVNNAGPPMQSGAIAELADEPWRSTFETKAMGAVRVSRAAIPVLADDGTGRIINITGVTAASLIPNAAVTGTINAGISAFTKYLATEVASRRILVNAVCPGVTLTEGWRRRAAAAAEAQGITTDEFFEAMTRRLGVILGRWAEPAEIANAVVFLASDLASFITGQTVVVDGGQAAKAI